VARRSLGQINKPLFLGRIMAKGPLNGGSVEISSANNLRYIGLKSIETGPGGHLLLDPKNITLGDAADASGWNYDGIIGVGYTGGKNLRYFRGVFKSGGCGKRESRQGGCFELRGGSYGDWGSYLLVELVIMMQMFSNSGKVLLFSFSDSKFSGGALNATIGLNETFSVDGLSA